ncbi:MULTISPECIES: GNAT family N-acetyltransferase [Brevibacillus]|uniref:GNAT family N-acetyltransferase n=1 Tax=Brevibacillus TaxID=55080 RepID=UPI00156AF71F|nr:MULTISPECIES: GNAT family N-acetyltransferase [Brevibacillus]MBU8714245.1 GNAT family N-acetyltransferase [Brevibacillus parabrevis]NRQ55835.1 GNAT family N-acetyltransferase [Brevibacillus sp. HD1.4A]UED67974.1 GNAT family N-acetyltransferase [Brevibacillus sp. HD3.3A]
MTPGLSYREVTQPSEAELRELARLLVDVVADGASIGFLPPLTEEEAYKYWTLVPREQVVVWVAEKETGIVGTIQLQLSDRPNGLHRAEIVKLMVHPSAQRQGIGRTLMLLAEARAMAENRSLLVLDTRAGDPSNQLYQAMGYKEAGRIPQYAKSADGELHDTVIYYKQIGE